MHIAFPPSAKKHWVKKEGRSWLPDKPAPRPVFRQWAGWFGLARLTGLRGPPPKRAGWYGLGSFIG